MAGVLARPLAAVDPVARHVAAHYGSVQRAPFLSMERPMRSSRLVTCAILVMVTVACASTSTEGRRTSGRRDARSLSAEEMKSSPASNLYDVIRSYRPEWLVKRGQTSINLEGDIVVYVDNIALGGPESLKSIDVQSVQSVRFLNASEAQMRYGIGHVHGAIVVTTRTS
jgi:hypothetical protein